MVSEFFYLLGAVPDIHNSIAPGDDPYNVANGDLTPEWGVDLKVKDSVIHYGPWTDRYH